MTCTSIKSGGIILVIWARTFRLSEMMRSCKCFPHMCRMQTVTYNRANIIIKKNTIILNDIRDIFNLRDMCKILLILKRSDGLNHIDVYHMWNKLITLPEHLSPLSGFSGGLVARLVICCVMFWVLLFILLSFFFWPRCCLSFFDLWLLIINYSSDVFKLYLYILYSNNTLMFTSVEIN
jgi:hypothetical protein